MDLPLAELVIVVYNHLVGSLRRKRRNLIVHISSKSQPLCKPPNYALLVMSHAHRALGINWTKESPNNCKLLVKMFVRSSRKEAFDRVVHKLCSAGLGRLVLLPGVSSALSALDPSYRSNGQAQEAIIFFKIQVPFKCSSIDGHKLFLDLL